MFDTHAHVNFNAFKDDADEVIKRALSKNVAMILVGSQLSTSARAVEMAKKYERVWAAVGLHPIQLEDFEVNEEGKSFVTRKEEFNPDQYKLMANNSKVVAIGETGLDYYHIDPKLNRTEVIAKQKQVFHQHIDLANELGLPIIVHTRDGKLSNDVALKDILSEIKKNKPKRGGILHSYGGTIELIPTFLELGFYFSVNGIATFDKTGRLAEVILKVPDNRLLVETDCPYLSPAPYRGKRNEPSYVEYVIQKVAEIKKMNFVDVERMTDQNAKRLLNV